MAESREINIREFLANHHIRPSQQRVAIMEYLLANKTHPTVDQIFEQLSVDIPSLSKTTVYNTLTLFSRHGITLVLTIDPRNLRFDSDTSTHAHFLCEVCGELHDIFLSKEQKEALQLLTRCEHQILDTQLNHKGVCKECRTHARYQV